MVNHMSVDADAVAEQRVAAVLAALVALVVAALVGCDGRPALARSGGEAGADRLA
jgi:hypothetical protein